jgi:myo-inositol-1-phosphate synthase
MPKEIRVAVAGVGNCTSSLVQGLYYYRDLKDDEEVPGLMHPRLGGYAIRDIVPVAAFDIDARKVGKDLSEAIFAAPNCTLKFSDVPHVGVEVIGTPVLDGLPEHLKRFFESGEYAPAQEEDVVDILRRSKADVLVNFLPTGSAEGARFFARACIKAGVGFVNGIPELIVSDPEFQQAAERAGSQLVGDDVKSQVGATILHRTLLQLFRDRGLKIKRTYQLNYGGNSDFINLVKRGESKEVTKTSALHAVVPYEIEASTGFGFLPILGDTKMAIVMVEGEKFGGAPIRVEAKLEVIDSPNSAGVIIDAIRCCKVARDRGVAGVLESASAYFMKHPPRQFPDEQARRMLEEFIAGTRER